MPGGKTWGGDIGLLNGSSLCPPLQKLRRVDCLDLDETARRLGHAIDGARRLGLA